MKLGVFDSGVGGMSVLQDILTYFPRGNFYYLGDTARLPYGAKSPQTIRKYTEQSLDFLTSLGVEALVIACNSASSQFRESEWRGIPVFNVIDPTARQACLITQTASIAVLGTRATIQSDVYKNTLQKIKPEIKVQSVACPLFVPLVEEGFLQGQITELVIHTYLNHLKDFDTLILGCTHYPLLLLSLKKYFGDKIHYVSSGHAVAKEMLSRLDYQAKTEDSKISVMATDLSQQFVNMTHMILGRDSVEKIIAVDLMN